MHYLKQQAGPPKRLPCVGDLLRDIDLLTANQARLDVEFTITIFLHAFWSLIHEFRQLSKIHRGTPLVVAAGNTTSTQPAPTSSQLLLESRQAELVSQLHEFSRRTSAWHEFTPQESLVLQLLLMNLHVSLDDLQLFAGREGEDEARRVFPRLQAWAASPTSRTALVHAARILGAARRFPQGHLKDFYAVAVHHAALALWTHALIRRSDVAAKVIKRDASDGGGAGGGARDTSAAATAVVYLDGDDDNTPALRTWIQGASGAVRPLIRSATASASASAASGTATGSGSGAGGASIALDDPEACMEAARDVLRANFAVGRGPASDDSYLPPIVDNLCGLLRQLGQVARAVSLSSASSASMAAAVASTATNSATA